jgi:hypothetical protein
MHFHPVCHAFLRLYVCRRPIAAPCLVRGVHTTHSLCLPWRFRRIRVSPYSPATLSMLLSFLPTPSPATLSLGCCRSSSEKRSVTTSGWYPDLWIQAYVSAALHRGSLLGLFLRRHYWQVNLFWALGIICHFRGPALHGLGVDGLGVDPWSVSRAV